MNITFVQIRRDCPYNDYVDEGRTGYDQIIYDHEVIDHGVHIATFMSMGIHGYYLADLGGHEVRGARAYGHHIKTKTEFSGMYLKVKAEGNIPTQEQIDERKVKAAIKRDLEKRCRRVAGAAHETFDLLKDLVAQMAREKPKRGVRDNFTYHLAKAHISKVEGRPE